MARLTRLGRAAFAASVASVTIAADAPIPLPPAEKPAAADVQSAPSPATGAMPIDLPTALRLVDENSPTIAVARARVDEAYARQQQAEVLWLPTLQTGVRYFRVDGREQASDGVIFTVSKSNLFAAAGASLRVNVADAIYLPLATRRLTDAAAASARATVNATQLDAALAYLDLLEAYGRLAVNADTLARAEDTLRRSIIADEAGLSRTKADISRIRTEVESRRQERIEIEGRASVASARLAQLTLLPPCCELRPADVCVLPLTLVPPCPCDELVSVANANRPELAAFRSVTGAAAERLRQAKAEPLLPKVSFDYAGGTFGGGRNDDMSRFDGRSAVGAALTWELRNMGLGYRAEVRERQAQVGVASQRVRELQAQVAAEVAANAKLSDARLRSLTPAQAAVREALELYRRLLESSFGVAGQRGQLDTVEPLLAIQALNQARIAYLTAVVDYDRAQFRLFTALGQPPSCALPGQPQAIDVPAAPPPPPAKSDKPS
ncbi:MAG: TolC family protein [Gemmataceae bacterium]